MQRPTEIENVLEKIHAIARKVLQHGIGDFVWAGGSCEKFNGGEGGSERRMRLFR